MALLQRNGRFNKTRHRPGEHRQTPRLNINKAIKSIYEHGAEVGYFGQNREFEVRRITFILCAAREHFSLPSVYREAMKSFALVQEFTVKIPRRRSGGGE